MVCLLCSTFVVQKCFHKNVPMKFACAGEKSSTFQIKEHVWTCLTMWSQLRHSMLLFVFVQSAKTEDCSIVLFCVWENKDWGLFWIAGVLAAANQCCFSYAAVLQSAEGFFLAYIFLMSQDLHSPQGKIQRDRCGIEFKNCDAYLNRMVFYWVYSSQSMYTGGSLIWCEACLIWYDCLRGCDDDGLVFFLHEIGQRITYNCHRKKLITQICNNETAIICFPVSSGTCNTRSPMRDEWASEEATPGPS